MTDAEVFDLDALAAEAGEGRPVKFRGKTYTLPPVLPLLVTDKLESADIRSALGDLFDDDEAIDAVMATLDQVQLLKFLGGLYGIDDLVKFADEASQRTNGDGPNRATRRAAAKKG